MHPERRKRRSTNTGEALAYQLDACRDGAQVEAMVLADADGLCLAGSGEGYPADEIAEIAAHGAILGTRAENFEGVLMAPERHYNVRVRGFEAAGSRLYLCAVGGGGEDRARRIQRSISGVKRILSA